MSRIRRLVFARHASPRSAWSRWATTPLVVVPVWRRSWRDAAWVAVWFALNPVIFAEPGDRSAWSTRAMLGEERWIVDRPRDGALALNAVASAAMAVALGGAYRRRLLPTAVATVVAMAVTLGYWQLMARYLERRSGDGT